MTFFPRNIPIRRKLMLVVLVSSTAALLVASTALFAFQIYTFRQNFMRDLASLGQIISANSTAAITFGDSDAAREILTGLRVKQQIEDAAIILPNGKVLARVGDGSVSVPVTDYPVSTGFKFQGGDLLQTQEIRMDNAKIATLYLRSAYGRMYADLLHLYLFALAAVLALSSGIAFAISSQLQRVISVPIQKLAETARVIAAGNDYSLRAEKIGHDEIGAFTDTFNHMLQQIQYQDTTLQAVQNTLEMQVEELQHEIAERKRAEEEVEALHNQLVEASRHAGMAEVATGVLHNVGNVLNSVNVSSTLLADRLRKSRAINVSRAADLMIARNGDLGNWLTEDPKGKMLPSYLADLGTHLATEHSEMTTELELLVKNVEHIKEIVAMQQNYAKVSGFIEILPAEKLMEDALQMNAAAFERHRVRVVRNFETVPNVRVDKHKVLQILVNLLRNAKYAMDDCEERRLDLEIKCASDTMVRVTMRDTGCGIPQENLTRIFSHGFTTKKDGHGFGLHSGAIAAKEMGGILTAESEGAGRGATFMLELPIAENFFPMNLMQNNRILVVDDNPAIHIDFKKILLDAARNGEHLDSAEAILFGDAKNGPGEFQEFELDSAMQGRDGLAMVKEALDAGRPYATAFVDVRMPPGWDGIETVARMWEVQPDLQVVICTAYSDYSWEDMMRRFGRSDNLLILKKPFDNVEVLQLAHALTKKWQVTRQASLRIEEMDVMVRQRTAELQAAHDWLRSSEERFSKAFHTSPIPMAILSLAEGLIADANEAFQGMTGFSEKEIFGQTAKELNFSPELETRAWPLLRGQKSVRNVECQVNSTTGEVRHGLISLELFSLGGEPHVLLIAEDLTDKRKLESELRQAQKMEAVGQLAAGVAHDFNNILTIIQGHASLHIGVPENAPEVEDSFQHISSAAERAAHLTRQLLAFSRKQVMQQRKLDLNGLVRQISAVLPRLIGEHIRLSTDLGAEMPPVFADDCNMEQIVLNLSVNARDAMPNGGTITVRTREILVTDEHLSMVPEAVSGRYVCLSVTDTGIGMDYQTRSRIFEPFFTTKDIGKGTGMGLATVYGIVKQHDGWLEVESEAGQGSTFKIYLPVCEENVAAAETRAPAASTGPAGAGQTVLVVEDDPSVRSLVKDILIHNRYKVIEAEDGEQALMLAHQHANEISLVLTDMVMPKGISGRELAERLTGERPDLKVIFTSGYSPDLFDSSLILEEGVNYLPKPYNAGMLARILRGALSEPALA